MDKLLKLRHKSENSDFISLFLPGFPGEYKDRPLFDDLKSYNSDIYSLTYPGTYSESGEFSLTSVMNAVKECLAVFRPLNKPILLISYSFSTLFISECIDKKDDIIGLLLFSPITDLKNSIYEDFINTLNELQNANTDSFNINIESFNRYIADSIDHNYLNRFLKLKILQIPMFFFLGEKDQGVKIDKVFAKINALELQQKLIFKVKEGEHALNTLYDDKFVKRAVLSIVFSYKLRKTLHNILGVFL